MNNKRHDQLYKPNQSIKRKCFLVFYCKARVLDGPNAAYLNYKAPDVKQVFAKTSYFVLIRTCARHVHMTLKQNCLPVYHHGISFSIYSIASFCLAAMAFCFVSTVCLSFKVITVIFDLFLSRIMILCPVDDRCVTCCWYSQIYELSGPRLSTVAVSKLLSDLKRLTLSC